MIRPPGPGEPSIAALLVDILAELRGLRRDLALTEAPDADQALVDAIRETVGGKLFTLAELMELAALDSGAALREAIEAAFGAAGVEAHSRKVGKRLRRISDDGSGRIARVTEERGGAVWRVC